ncbi:MAG: hypothetical protein H6621_04065 [Halobacteriovoraceae bacterium]|nr:hypothetical protein [Halobacteriovoraceae bacterium]MCB9094225.1 hypothetical protein [Halobacteriovoraceae bacterium]
MKKEFLTLLVSLTFVSPVFSQIEGVTDAGKRTDIVQECKKLGGAINVNEVTETDDKTGQSKVCLKDVTCVEEDDTGYSRIMNRYKDKCVSQKAWDDILNKKKIEILFNTGGSSGGTVINGENCPTCKEGSVTIGPFQAGIGAGNMCTEVCTKYKYYQHEYFSKGKGGFLGIGSRKAKYNRYKKRCFKCLFGDAAAKCLLGKKSGKKCVGVFMNAGIYPGGAKGSVVVRGGSLDCTYNSTTCPSQQEYAEYLEEFLDTEECVDCRDKMSRKNKRRGRDRDGRGGGNAAGILSAILNPLAYFGSNYFTSKHMKDACVNSYTAYTGSVDNLNANIAAENYDPKRLDPTYAGPFHDRSTDELPLKDFITPRTAKCNGYSSGSFAGLAGPMGSAYGPAGATANGMYTNPLFPGSYYGANQGLHLYNPYAGLGNLGGSINFGIGNPYGNFGGGYGNYPGWGQNGYYPQNGNPWAAGANGHLPYGNYSVRSMMYPQNYQYQMGITQQAKYRDAMYYQNRFYGPYTQYSQPPFPPVQ